VAEIPEGLRELVGRLEPGSEVVAVEPLAPDTGEGETRKGGGYGVPLRVTVRDARGASRVLVFRTATSNVFGHDRRADRAAEMLLAWDTFNAVPDHVRALDVGTILPGGRLLSVREGGEFYLLTSFAEGRMYAEDLRAAAARGEATVQDLARAEALAGWLVRLHAGKLSDPDAYRRAVRDLVGHGEGIFGMVDGYGPEVPGAPPGRLRRLEELALSWRWRLRGREGRLARTHGDFHPFNVVFEEGAGTGFTLLDASRGGRGDPADDVTCLSVNYVFFALDRPGSWARGLGPLWRRFWQVYLRESGDREVLEVAAPWLAWRALVIASPRFYPDLPAAAREALLDLAERALGGARFDPAAAEELFR
jgi:hypothetical protein